MTLNVSADDIPLNSKDPYEVKACIPMGRYRRTVDFVHGLGAGS